jgi:trehalose 6-phosphate synthase
MRYVIVSNRTPSGGPPVGGLQVALMNVIRDRGGLWFGWSGKITEERSRRPDIRKSGPASVATVDLTEGDYEGYYAGYANRVLWPVFHHHVHLAAFDPAAYRRYLAVNAYFAQRLAPLLRPDDVVWVHDFHLIPLARELRALGVSTPIGFFLHIPMPVPSIIAAVPQHRALIRDLFAYNLIGFQAKRDLRAFNDYVTRELGGTIDNDSIARAFDVGVRAGVFPIGIEPDSFAELAVSAVAQRERHRMIGSLGGRDLIIGVDRLDYSKGIQQRLDAFEQLLDDHPEVRRRISMLQVAPPSRSSIPEYVEMRHRLDETCGHINGRFAEFDWVPIRYVQRAYAQESLAGLYRLAGIGLVTPLRDGMNLVAKEYVAAQDPRDPGVLILSRFAGAAERMRDALLVNPYDKQQVADAMFEASRMPVEERRRRWQSLMDDLRRYTIDDWRDDFLETLAASKELTDHISGGTAGVPEKAVGMDPI